MKRNYLGLMVCLLLLLGLSACGTSGSSDGASTSSSSASSTTSASGNGSKERTAAEAQALLEKAEVRPTSLPEKLPPIGKPVPSGKKIVWINCGVQACVETGEAVQHAAATLGWQTQMINTDGSSTQLESAWEQALREDPYAITSGGTERAMVQRYLNEAESKGIEVALAATNEPDGSPAIGEGIDFNYGSSEFLTDAPVFANFITANTNAEGEAVYVTIPGLPVFEATEESLKTDLAAECPKCSLDTLEIALGQLGSNTPTLIVAYLRSHPDVKTMVLAADDILGVGLPAALNAAGLNDVEFTGSGGDQTSLQYVEAGQQASSIASRLTENAYGLVDYLARRAAGAKPIAAMSIPAWVLTKGNIPTLNSHFPVIADIESIYEAAWKK